ncbi:MAG TPA: Spy/CpxP family protein refolding chaperone [Pyrinomonadaceae bacterium]|jgi:Spy/CpxP family protein refolding chaperone
MRVVLNKIALGKGLAAAAFGLALALLPLCTSARAQNAPQAAGQAARPQRPGRPGAAPLMRRLNLTPEQRQRLQEIRTQGEPEARELTRRVRLARRALDEAIYSDAAEESLVEQRARELAAAQAAAVRHRAATELKVRRVLTPEQLQTFRELRRQAQRRQLMQRRLRNAAPQPPPDAEPFK